MGQPPREDDPDEPSEPADAVAGDPDRAAILARRQRFIALALTGLTTTACDKPNEDPASPRDSKAVQDGRGDEDGAPHPCLKVAKDPDPEGSTGTPEPKPGRPQPCLDVSPPQDEDPFGGPNACLKIAVPEEPEPDPRPHACLKVARPEPEKPKPQPCLNVARPEPEPKPQPCLRVAKPK